ncbi:unnamed protein product, partial [Laminaria digitata]
KAQGWAEQLTALGDRLFDSDNIPAAHALFLVAGIQVELPTTKGARIVLPGVDHRKPFHRALRTREATDAVHVLEVLEVAFSDGGRGKQNSAVQGHKLRMAMRLADLGFVEKAHCYVQSAQAEVAAMGGRSRGGSEQRSPYSPQFITALHEFGDRARASLGVEADTGGGGGGGGGGGNLEGGGRKGEKTTAGSAAAEAGGWLLNRVTSLVKTSATPGPAPTNARPLPSKPQPTAEPDQGALEPATWQAPQPSSFTAPFRQQQSPFSREAGVGRGGGGNTHPSPPSSTGTGTPPPLPLPAAVRGGGSGRAGSRKTLAPYQEPRPPGVGVSRPAALPSTGEAGAFPAGGAAAAAAPPPPPQRQAFPGSAGGGGRFGEVPRNTGSPAFGESFGQSFGHSGPPGSPALTPPPPTLASGPGPGPGLAGEPQRHPAAVGGGTEASEAAAVVAKGILARGGGSGGAGEGRGGGAGPPGQRGGDEAAGGGSGKREGGEGKGGKGKGGGGDQAPKSEPRKGTKGKGVQRRASVGAPAVGAKPGRLAKIMSKWLYPEAKHADVGNEMEAYYDEKAKRWVFPGENPGEAAAATPLAPPTTSQLGSPSNSQAGGPGGGGGAAGAPPPPTPGLDANDPLAALMAPPQVMIGAPRRHTTAGSGPPGSGPPSEGMNWAAAGAPPMSGGGGGGGGGAWGGARGGTRSPFSAEGNMTAFAPKAPMSSSGRGGGGEGEGGGVEGAAG